MSEKSKERRGEKKKKRRQKAMNLVATMFAW
jgi:hypothetical protein